VDAESIVLSIKRNKQNPNRPGKNVTALIPFTKIGDAFAAVMASGRGDHNLDRVDVSWASGGEPELVTWLRERGQLGSSRDAGSSTVPDKDVTDQEMNGLNGDETTFSSFPDIFVSQDIHNLGYLLLQVPYFTIAQ